MPSIPFFTAGTAAVVLGIISLVTDERPAVASNAPQSPRVAILPMVGQVRGASLSVVGF